VSGKAARASKARRVLAVMAVVDHWRKQGWHDDLRPFLRRMFPALA
jgi:hypothetical protein